MHYLLISLIFLASTACAPLKHGNTASEDVGEVILRTIACPVTLCLSEIMVKTERQQEAAQRRYWAWYQDLSPEQQDREDQRRERALGFMLQRSMLANQQINTMMNHMPLFTAPPPVVTPPASAPLQRYQLPAMRQPMNCTSVQNGAYTNTNCY